MLITVFVGSNFEDRESVKDHFGFVKECMSIKLIAL